MPIEVRQAIVAVDQAVARHGVRLEAAPTASLEVHAALVRELMVLAELVGDNSLLMLDPDADCYYLMLAATDKLPKALEMVGQIRAHGVEVLAARQLQGEGQARFIGEMAVLRARLDEADAVLRKAEAANPQVAERIARFSRQFREALKDVMVEVDDDIFAGRYAADPDRYIEKTTLAIDRGFDQTRDVMLPLLDELLAARIRQMEAQFSGAPCWPGRLSCCCSCTWRRARA